MQQQNKKTKKKIITLCLIILIFFSFNNIVFVNGDPNPPPPPATPPAATSATGMTKLSDNSYVLTRLYDLYYNKDTKEWANVVSRDSNKVWTFGDNVKYVFNQNGAYYTYTSDPNIITLYKDGKSIEITKDIFDSLKLGLGTITKIDPNTKVITFENGQYLQYSNDQYHIYTLYDSEGNTKITYRLEKGVVFKVTYDKDGEPDKYFIGDQKVSEKDYFAFQKIITTNSNIPVDLNIEATKFLYKAYKSGNADNIQFSNGQLSYSNSDGVIYTYYTQASNGIPLGTTEIKDKDGNTIYKTAQGTKIGGCEGTCYKTGNIYKKVPTNSIDCGLNSDCLNAFQLNHEYGKFVLGLNVGFSYLDALLKGITDGAKAGNTVWAVGKWIFDKWAWIDSDYELGGNWKKYSEWFENQVIGGDYKADESCRQQFHTDSSGYTGNVLSSGISAGAYIAATRSSPITYTNNSVTTTEYLYKITYSASAPKEKLVFNIYLNPGNVKYYTTSKTVKKGDNIYASGYQAQLEYSTRLFTEICMVFEYGAGNFADDYGNVPENKICTTIAESNDAADRQALFDSGQGTYGGLPGLPDSWIGEGDTNNNNNGGSTSGGGSGNSGEGDVTSDPNTDKNDI